MDYKEALEWLKGERSLCNIMPYETQQAVAEADAACTQKAYWIVKAHHEMPDEFE